MQKVLHYQNLAQNALCTSTRSALDFLSVLSMTAGCGHLHLLAGTQLYSPEAELSLASSSLLGRRCPLAVGGSGAARHILAASSAGPLHRKPSLGVMFPPSPVTAGTFPALVPSARRDCGQETHQRLPASCAAAPLALDGRAQRLRPAARPPTYSRKALWRHRARARRRRSRNRRADRAAPGARLRASQPGRPRWRLRGGRLNGLDGGRGRGRQRGGHRLGTGKGWHLGRRRGRGPGAALHAHHTFWRLAQPTWRNGAWRTAAVVGEGPQAAEQVLALGREQAPVHGAGRATQRYPTLEGQQQASSRPCFPA